MNAYRWRNIEGRRDYDLPRDFWRGRRPGLSAMVRLKDEAEWVLPALDSIAGWCDEIAIALQGAQADGTDRLVEGWARGRPEVAVRYYPFDSRPNGPGHDAQPRGSLHERAYFYNWALAQTTRTHVMKWDGDMVALDGLGDRVRAHLPALETLRFRGVDICGAALRHTSARPYTRNEIRVFRVHAQSYYVTGRMTEWLLRDAEPGPALAGDAYLHFKWAKALSAATTAWPADWRESPHFLEVYARKARPGARYRGPWPSLLAARRCAS